jgi:hypothetical protein
MSHNCFLTDVPEFSARGHDRGRGMDASRTFLEKIVSFPENINVEVNQTFHAARPQPRASGGGATRGGLRGNSATVRDLAQHGQAAGSPR